MEAIVNELRRSIESSGLTYAALLDDQLVLAGVFRRQDGGHRVGTLRGDRRCSTCATDCSELEARWNVSLDFSFASISSAPS